MSKKFLKYGVRTLFTIAVAFNGIVLGITCRVIENKLIFMSEKFLIMR